MSLRSAPATVAGVLVLLLLAALPSLGGQRQAEISGVVTGFDQGSRVLNVNTRLGARLFQLTTTTLVLLNTRSSTAANIQPGDRVEVTYRVGTAVATIVHLHRESRLTGRVTAAANNTVTVRVNGALVNLTADASSQVRLNGILIADRRVLVGRRIRVRYEPGSFLILGAVGSAPLARGTVSLVDSEENILRLAGDPERVFNFESFATVVRDGETARFQDLATGDRVRVLFVRDGEILRGLAVVAESPDVTP